MPLYILNKRTLNSSCSIANVGVNPLCIFKCATACWTFYRFFGGSALILIAVEFRSMYMSVCPSRIVLRYDWRTLSLYAVIRALFGLNIDGCSGLAVVRCSFLLIRCSTSMRILLSVLALCLVMCCLMLIVYSNLMLPLLVKSGTFRKLISRN